MSKHSAKNSDKPKHFNDFILGKVIVEEEHERALLA